VDGSVAVNHTNLNVAGQAIADWPPGAALWLVWQMVDTTGKAQGLAIDNLSFSASGQNVSNQIPLGFQATSTNLVLSWTGTAGETYQVEYKDDLGAATWSSLGNPIPGTGAVITVPTDFSLSNQRYYRLRILP